MATMNSVESKAPLWRVSVSAHICPNCSIGRLAFWKTLRARSPSSRSLEGLTDNHVLKYFARSSGLRGDTTLLAFGGCGAATLGEVTAPGASMPSNLGNGPAVPTLA